MNCKMNFRFVLLFLLFLFAHATLSLGQIDEFVCGHSDEGSGGESMHISNHPLMKGDKNSPFIINRVNPNPAGRNFKIAILYFKRNDDTFDAPVPPYNSDQHCKVAEWPLTSDGPDLRKQDK